MPVLLHPDACFDYVLESDRGVEHARGEPSFRFRALSAREGIALLREADQIDDLIDGKLPSGADVFAGELALVKRGLVGWKNLYRGTEPVPFALDALDDLVTMQEALELRMAFLRGPLTGDDAKKSKSQSPSSTESSAESAAPKAA